MQIAVTSQNFRTVTGHAGKGRRFLIYEVDGTSTTEVNRLDLPKEMSFHEFGGIAHPLDGTAVLVTHSCGDGFRQKMAHRGIQVVLTDLEDPVAAAAAGYAAVTAAVPVPQSG